MSVARTALVVLLLASVAGCSFTTPPPKRQADICQVFAQYPDWYDYAVKSQQKWGTPVHILMAFVRHESSYRSHARPPRRWLWFIPLGRPSSAKGYAQAQVPVWGEYQAERGRLFRSRSDMEDAL
ncbi:MAG: lysozyme-like domain containing protein, partial [Deltaproteobacteria bacterium]|nr:lysozyme-like domain containing protein [Deltaproteobacteria bacterium]